MKLAIYFKHLMFVHPVEEFPCVTEDGSWPPAPNVKKYNYYMDEDSDKAKKTPGKKHESFTPTIVEGAINPRFDQLPMWRKVKTNVKGDLPQITYALHHMIPWKKSETNKFWEPFDLRLPRETTYPTLDTTEKNTGKPIITPCHEFRIAKGYKTPEEEGDQVSLIHFEPDLPPFIREVFDRFNEHEHSFALKYWSASHYHKYFTRDSELVSNNVLYGIETATCSHTDMKPCLMSPNL